MKYTKQQNGFLGQEFVKALLEHNPDATEFEKELVSDLGLELALLKNYYTDFSKEHIIRCLDKVWKDAKQKRIDDLKKQLATLE